MESLDEALRNAGSETEIANILLENSDNIRSSFQNNSREEAVTELPIQHEDAPKHQETVTAPAQGCPTFQEHCRRKTSKQYRATEPVSRPRCDHCSSTELIYDDHHGDIVCIDCATAVTAGPNNDSYLSLPYTDHVRLTSYINNKRKKNIYKKTNYFADMLHFLCGRQSTKIPEEVIDYVRGQTQKEDQQPAPTATCVKNVLKRAGLRNMYRHSWLIANIISDNFSAVRLNYTEEDLLKYMFAKFQNRFARTKGTRKNCLNYNYVIYQMLRLLNREDLCQHVTLLRSKPRLIAHDNIWMTCCEAAGWPFLPTVESHTESEPSRRNRQVSTFEYSWT